MKNKIIPALIIMLIFSSCTVWKNYKPQQLTNTNVLREDLLDNTVKIDTTILISWRNFYNNEQLKCLIEEGLNNNSETKIATLQIQETMAMLRGVRGYFLPNVNLSTNGNINYYIGEKSSRTYSVNSTIDWEPDINGRKRNSFKEAEAMLDIQKFNAEQIRVNLITTVAQCYYTLEMLDKKRLLTIESINKWDEHIKILTMLFNAGEVEQSSITQAKASKAEVQSILPQIELQIFETENQLSILLGRQSGKILLDTFSTSEFNYQLTKSIPLNAIATRSDVRKAEAELRRMFYQTNIARSAFYPSLNLSGSLGWTNDNNIVITNPEKMLCNAITSLTQPLFSAGRNKANLNAAKSRQEQALIQFNQTLLEAGKQVNNALQTYHTAKKITQNKEQQIKNFEETLHTANITLQNGDGNALQVIVARQSLLTAQIEKLSFEYLQMESYIKLFQSLGGGYEIQE